MGKVIMTSGYFALNSNRAEQLSRDFWEIKCHLVETIKATIFQ